MYTFNMFTMSLGQQLHLSTLTSLSDFIFRIIPKDTNEL